MLEGDDVLGIMATGSEIVGGPGNKVIVSIDKDMKTLPCTYFNYDDKKFLAFSEPEADYNHLIQTLTGDTADGYPGCPGIGIKTAEKLLSPCLIDGDFASTTAWEIVVEQFEKKGFGEDYALSQARVARICRNTDYDFHNSRPILWKP